MRVDTLDPQDHEDRAREKKAATGTCMFLVRKEDEWLKKWGSAEGKKEWIALDLSYKNKKSQAAAYGRLKKQAVRNHFLFGFECSQGLPFRVTREIVGPFFHERYTTAFCDRQENCKKYYPYDQALIDLAKFPKGSA